MKAGSPMFNDPRFRKSLYAVASALGVVLVAYGAISQELADSIMAVLPGLILTGFGGLAAAKTHTSPTVAADGSLPVYTGGTVNDYTGKHRAE